MIKVTLEFNTIAEMLAHFSNSAASAADALKQMQYVQHQQHQPVTQPGMNIPAVQNDDDGPANTNAPNTDTAGLPWDERIHSTKKGLNADGTWRKRRGVEAAFITQVETELRARGAQQAGMYMPPGPAPQQYQQPLSQPGIQYSPPPGQYVPPQMQPGPAPQQYQQPQPGPGPQSMPQPAPQQGMDFNGFMSHLMQRMQQRGADGQPLIEHNYLITVVQRLNAAFGKQYQAITDIGNEPQLVSYAQQLIAADGRWQ